MKDKNNIRHIKIEPNIYLQFYNTTPAIIVRKKCRISKRLNQKYFNLNDYYYDEAIHHARTHLSYLNTLEKNNLI